MRVLHVHERVGGWPVEYFGSGDVIHREIPRVLVGGGGPAGSVVEGGDGHADRYMLVTVSVAELSEWPGSQNTKRRPGLGTASAALD